MSRLGADGTEAIPRAHKVLLPVELQEYLCRCTRCKQVFADHTSFCRQHLRPNTRCNPRSTTELYARLRLANHPTSPWAQQPGQAAAALIDERLANWTSPSSLRGEGEARGGQKRNASVTLEQLPPECQGSLSVLMVHVLGVPRRRTCRPPDERWLRTALQENARRLRWRSLASMMARLRPNA